jgi:hypothetical protein
MSKYNNSKTVVDGISFDSQKEAARYQELKLFERAGEVSNIERQVEYQLIPKQPGERAVKYIADFRYKAKEGQTIVEDVKGYKTEVYKIKRKLMLYVHGIKIRET